MKITSMGQSFFLDTNKGKEILESGILLDLVAEIGYARFREMGETTYPEIAKCIISKPVSSIYNNISGVMMRGTNHLLLLWPQSWFKSSIIESFIGYGRNKNYGLLPQNIRVCTPQSITPEKFRGSSYTEEGKEKLITPYPVKYDLISIDELLAFLGAGENSERMLNLVCSIIESGRGELDLVKTSRLTLESIEEKYRNNFKLQEGGRVEYETNTSLVLACHYLDYRLMQIFKTHGMLSRLTVQTWDADWTDKINLLKSLTDNNEPNLKGYLIEDVRSAFNIIYNMRFERVTQPPREYEKECLNIVESRVNALLDVGSGIDPEDIINGRLSGVIKREIVYHAVVKQVERQGMKNKYEDIVYDDTDFDYIVKRMKRIIDSSINLGMITKNKSTENIDVTSNSLENAVFNILSKSQTFKNVIVKQLNNVLGISRQNIYRNIDKMISQQKIYARQLSPEKTLLSLSKLD